MKDNKPVLYAEYIDWRGYWIISNPSRADLSSKGVTI